LDISGIEVLSLLKIAIPSKSINSEQQLNPNRFSYVLECDSIDSAIHSRKILRRIIRGMAR